MLIDDKAFCFWDAASLVDTIIIIIDTCVASVLFGLVLRTYLKAKKILK